MEKRITLLRKVSIHASVKDATMFTLILRLLVVVSIHASVKDATDEDGNAFKVDFVSIHASVKDATFRVQKVTMLYIRFNPRICKRCDKNTCHYLNV